MAKYTIKDLVIYWSNNVRPSYPDDAPKTFLFEDYFNPPTDTETEDTRPEFIKSYVDVDITTYYMIDYATHGKYSDWVFLHEFDSVDRAYDLFRRMAIIFVLTHKNELSKVYDAFNSKFNPVENYDRYEQTTVEGESTTGTTSKVAPDDAETFFNTGSADASTETNTGTTSHIHGNIGVTEAVAMIDHSVQYFGNNAWMDYFIERILSENCYLLDNGYNTI